MGEAMMTGRGPRAPALLLVDADLLRSVNGFTAPVGCDFPAAGGVGDDRRGGRREEPRGGGSPARVAPQSQVRVFQAPSS